MPDIEKTILENLVYDNDYARKVLPFLKGEYFGNTGEPSRIAFSIIHDHYSKYNAPPSKDVILIEIDRIDIPDVVYKKTVEFVKSFEKTNVNQKWLIEQTEKFCKDKAIYNAIMESVSIISGKKKQPRGIIPDILKDALSVSFDANIGHDYFEDAEKRYEFYHEYVEKYDFDIEIFNKVTDGGLRKKTLTVFMAATGGCKSLTLCHIAAHNLLMGRNVLYISLEMSEEHVNERIDANLLDIPLNELRNLTKEQYLRKINGIKNRTNGKLIVKEYPTSTASVIHFRHLLSELELKKNFVPDIIFIDYIGICASSRIKPGSGANSYTYVKAIAEEFRGLAVEYDVPVVTAVQANREAYGSSDIDIDNVSESMGLSHTADYMFGITQTEELEELGQLMFKQLKNRYGDVSRYKRFVVGVDKSRMKLYNVEQNAQLETNSDDSDIPVFDNSELGKDLSFNIEEITDAFK